MLTRLLSFTSTISFRSHSSVRSFRGGAKVGRHLRSSDGPPPGIFGGGGGTSLSPDDPHIVRRGNPCWRCGSAGARLAGPIHDHQHTFHREEADPCVGLYGRSIRLVRIEKGSTKGCQEGHGRST